MEFAFDEAGEPSFDDAAPSFVEGGAAAVAIEAVEQDASEEPVSASMFDGTYMPPAAADVVVAEPQFDVTPPRAMVDGPPASMFDARPSESYGEPSAEAAVTFEAEDSVMFEEAFEAEAFEAVPNIDDPVVADEPALPERVDAGTSDDVSTPGVFATPALQDAAPDDVIDSPAAVSDTDDRVLLQFAATVPHDLAELRRIAADNQW